MVKHSLPLSRSFPLLVLLKEYELDVIECLELGRTVVSGLHSFLGDILRKRSNQMRDGATRLSLMATLCRIEGVLQPIYKHRYPGQ